MGRLPERWDKIHTWEEHSRCKEAAGIFLGAGDSDNATLLQLLRKVHTDTELEYSRLLESVSSVSEQD